MNLKINNSRLKSNQLLPEGLANGWLFYLSCCVIGRQRSRTHSETGRKYYLDKGGIYKEGVELPHVDVHRMENGLNNEEAHIQIASDELNYNQEYYNTVKKRGR